MKFPRQEYWSGLPFPSPGGLPDPGIEPICVGRWIFFFFTTKLPGKPTYVNILVHMMIKYYVLLFHYSFMWCTGSLLPLMGFLWLRHVEAALWCGGFSYCRAWALGHAGFSSWSLRALQCGLRCGLQALLLCSMWDPSGSGLEPMSPALAGGFLTPGTLGKFLQEPFY